MINTDSAFQKVYEEVSAEVEMQKRECIHRIVLSD